MNSTIFHDPADTVAARHQQRRQAARQRWHEYPRRDIESRAGFIVDRATGHLFERINSVVFASGVALDNEGKDCAGFVDIGGELVFLRRAAGPSTVDELEAQEAARERQEQEREQAHARFLREQPKRTLRRCDFDADWSTPTLREAARLLLDSACTIENQDGHLVVQVPEMLNPDGNLHVEAIKHVVRAARVLDAAGPVVLDAIERGGKTPLTDRLPDRHAGAFGGIA